MKKFLLAVIAAVFILGGCKGSVAVPVSIEPPVIKSFAAEPAIIDRGDSAQIIWMVSNATKVVIDNGIGMVALSGSFAVKPTGDVSYKLTATNAAGSNSAVVTVRVRNQGDSDITQVSAGSDLSVDAGLASPSIPDKPVIHSFSARPENIVSGDRSTLTWVVENADTLTIDKGIGGVNAKGVVNVKPTETTSYLLTAVNRVGKATATTIVKVGAPAIPVVKVFMASPATIVKGFPSKISWDVEGAEYVRISGVGSVRDSGSLLVYPGSSIIYTLYASNRGGSCESTCEVTVEEP